MSTSTPTPTAPPVPVFSSAQFTYDGDGRRVKSVITNNVGSTTTFFVGTHYEVTGTSITKYYFAGSQRIAIPQGDDVRQGSTIYYLLSDHLGSTSIVTDAAGQVISQTKYKAWGGVRYSSGSMPTQYQFTGQYSHQLEFGLLFFNARWLDPYLNHFTQPDSIVPPGVQGLDRYGYVNNSPMNYVDPSGHDPWWCEGDDSCMFNWMEDHTSTGGDGYFTEYEVTVDPKMNKRERRAIMAGIFAVGDAFAETRGTGETASEAFTAVFNPFSFVKEDREGCKFNSDTGNVGCGSFTYDKFQSDVNNVVHELGHVFSNVVGGDPEAYFDQMCAYQRNDILRPVNSPDGIDWQQHPPPKNGNNPYGEMFGDVLVAWVFDAWNTSQLNVDAVNSAKADTVRGIQHFIVNVYFTADIRYIRLAELYLYSRRQKYGGRNSW